MNEKSRNALASLNKTNLSSVLENQQAVAQGNNSQSKVATDLRDPRTASVVIVRHGVCTEYNCPFSYHWSYFKPKSLYWWPSRRNHKLIWNRESTCQTRKIFFQYWTSPSVFCSSTRFSTKENYFNYYSNRKWYELLQETSFSLPPPLYGPLHLFCRKHPKI